MSGRMAAGWKETSMKSRKAFTLIELLAVIGILALLAAILLPVIGHAQRSAAITAQKMDFQTIATALENYRSDFGDYPRNVILPRWNTAIYVPSPAITPAPPFLALAAALIGQDPGTPQMQTIGGQSIFVPGDGAEGLGFRTRIQVAQLVPPTALATDVPVGSALAIVTAVPITLPYNWAQVPNDPSLLEVISIRFSPGTQYEETIGISAVVPAHPGPPPLGPYTLQLRAATRYLHHVIDPAQPQLLMATGKVWPAYLPADRFQVAYVDPQRDSTTDVPTNLHMPVLLDHWGGVIQYFTRFGPNSNRVSDSTYSTNPAVFGLPILPTNITAGPLYGYSAPPSVDTTTPMNVNNPYGMNAIWDQRDGVAFVDNTDLQNPKLVTWQSQVSGKRPDLTLAIKWMLGDDNGDNFIAGGETLRYTGPYILISAGPDGPDRFSGGFCDLSSVPQFQWPKAFQNSGNIYNFER